MKIPSAYHRVLGYQASGQPPVQGDTAGAALKIAQFPVMADPYRPANNSAHTDASNALKRSAGHVQSAETPLDSGARNPYARDETEWYRQDHQAVERDAATFTPCPFCKTLYPTALSEHIDSICMTCGGPLFVPPKARLAQDPRRSAGRLVRHGEIALFTTWPQQQAHRGQLRNVSPNGMQFQTHVPLEDQGIIRITSDFLTSIARVTHTSDQRIGAARGYVVGVEFCTIRYVSARGSFFSAMT